MRLRRSVLVAAGAALLLPLTSPAFGAATTPSAGSATSSATLLTITAAGHTVAVGRIEAVAQTVTSAVPTVRFVPLVVDGTKTGEVVVDPSNSPKSVGGVTTSGVPAAILAATSPSAELRATRATAGPTSELIAGLGSASLLGMPLALDGGLDGGSTTTTGQALAGKALTVGRIALPSIADVLATLGIDLSALPVATLNGLLEQLPLTVSAAAATAAEAANTAISTAQAAVTTAQAAVDAQQAAVDAAQAQVSSAQSTFDTALAATGMTIDQWNLLTDTARQAFTEAYAAWTALQTTQAALTAAQAQLATVQATLQAAIDTLNAAIANLVDIVRGVLDGTPLAEIGGAEVSTKALVSGTKTAAVTGTVTGVKVLGGDVLQAVLGSSTLDVANLVGSVADQVNSAIATATGTLSSVLSTVTGATGLVVPAPTVTVLKKSTRTGLVGGYGTADATVTTLKITLGSVTVPTALALPNAASLPGITQTATGFTTAPLSIEVASLAEAARFRPGSTTPGSGNELPMTGAPLGLAVLAALAVAGGLGMRRLTRAAA